MGLLDVNALVALAWDSHVHHARMRAWFADHGAAGWATCPVSESGFVRVSSNPKVLPSPIGVAAARAVLTALRTAGAHRFLADDVSLTDADVPEIPATDWSPTRTCSRWHGAGSATDHLRRRHREPRGWT